MQPPPPGKIRRRRKRSKHHLDPILPRQISHRLPVVLSHLRSHRPRIPGDIITSTQNHHYLRMQVHYILPKPRHHLRRSLSADSAIHIRLPGKELTSIPPPELRHRSPIEHHPILTHSRRSQRLVRLPVMSQLSPIVELHLHRGNQLLCITLHRHRSRSSSSLCKPHSTQRRPTRQKTNPH